MKTWKNITRTAAEFCGIASGADVGLNPRKRLLSAGAGPQIKNKEGLSWGVSQHSRLRYVVPQEGHPIKIRIPLSVEVQALALQAARSLAETQEANNANIAAADRIIQDLLGMLKAQLGGIR